MSGRRRSSRSDARSRALVRAWRFVGAVALAVLAVPGAQGQTDTTATTSWPSARRLAIRAATARMRSGLATEEPPYFCTTIMEPF